MSTIVIIVIAVIAAILGSVIASLMTKNRTQAALSGMQIKLETAEQNLITKQQELSVTNGKLEALQQQHSELNMQKAGADKQLELLNASLEEHKSLALGREAELSVKQSALTEALQLKTAAEISLSEAAKNIAALQKREGDQIKNLDDLQIRLTAIKEENAALEAKAQATLERLAEQQQFVAEAQTNLKDAFGTLSADALQRNNKSFVELAQARLGEKVNEAKGELEKKQQAIDAVVKPLSDSLSKMDEKINTLESKREGAYSQMSTLLEQMRLSTKSLDDETRSLVNALKTSTSRGRYGEIALRRLVEFAGMLEHCDFEEQVSTDGENGRLRPDMIIRLPEKRMVVVDSKVPLAAYLEIFETEDHALQRQLMDRHVAAIKTHLKQLGAKAYWDQFAEAPDFVIMFMQIESSFGAALQVWPGMIEEALNNRIMIATPTTLITMLRSIGYSWNQLSTMENIESIRDAAVELYERSVTLMEHVANIGKGLTGTINHYNKAVGSLESSFLPQGRRISQLAQGFVKKTLPEVTPVEVSTREVVALPPQSQTGEGV